MSTDYATVLKICFTRIDDFSNMSLGNEESYMSPPPDYMSLSDYDYVVAI